MKRYWITALSVILPAAAAPAGTGTLHVNGNYTATASATLRLEVDWDGTGTPVPGVDCDLVTATGAFEAGGASLEVPVTTLTPATAPAGARLPLITSAAQPGGRFFQGTSLTSAGIAFTVDYGGLAGTDIELLIPGGSAPLGDDDGDGIANLLEQAFATSADNAASGAEGLPVVTSSGASTVITWRQLQNPGTVSYQVQASPDLTTWTPVAGAVKSDQAGAPPGTTLWEAAVPLVPGQRQFLRVAVTRPAD